MIRNIIFFVFFIALCLATLLNYRHKVIVLTSRIDDLTLMNDAIINMATFTSSVANVEIGTDAVFTLDNKPISWDEVFVKENKLVVYVSETNCSECIISQLPYLNQLEKEIGHDKIIIIGSYKNIRRFATFIEQNNISYKAFWKPLVINKTKFEIINMPYLMFIDENNIGSHLFYPLKEIPNLSKHYFKALKTKFGT